jgi:hypothetical protein
MGVPNVFGSATTSIPLSQLDANFNTGLTIGNTTIGLGNTTTTLGNVTLTNANFGGVANAVIYTTSTGNSTSNASVFSVSGTNVGIGTSSPATKLDVSGPASVTSFTGTTSLGLTVRGATGATDYSGIDFRSANANSGAQAVARIATFASASGSSLSFGTSNSYGSGITNTAMTINPAANVQFNATIGVGNATPTTSGAGITFPATQSASSDANTLDDYEEGTWTPTAAFSSGTLTSYTSSGIYTKIGNIVVLQAQVTITVGVGGAGAVVISGFPFTVSGSSEWGAYGRENSNTGKMLNGSISSTQVALYFYDNSFCGANANSLPVTIVYRTS